MIFKNPQEAGQQLAEKLTTYKNNNQAIVLGLPRGGVVVAYEVAKILNLPLDIIVTRKIGAPGNEEFAIGSISEEGRGVFDEETISAQMITREYIDSQVKKEKEEIKRRLEKYREGREPLDLKNKIAIIVDDGIATGSTVRAAIMSAREKGSQSIIVATPVVARDALKKIAQEVDEVIYLQAPILFYAVGQFYKDFTQTEDEIVINLLKKI